MTRILLLVLLALSTGALAQQSIDSDVKQGVSGVQVGSEIPNTLEETKKLPLKIVRKLLADRGLKCEGCSEKGDLVDMLWQNRDAPVKPKEELFDRPVKRGAASNGNEDYEAIMRQIQEEQNKNNKFKKLLEEKGINTAGMNFGGNSGDPAKLAELLEKLQHAKPPSPGPDDEGTPVDADARREDIRQQHAERLKQRRAEARRRKAAEKEEDVTEL